MAAKKSGLGKGLDSLISKNVNTEQLNRGLAKEEAGSEPVIQVKISKVEPNREQPRKSFDEEGLAELADSIRQYGIIQPLIVQDKGKYYEIIAGERRWRAAKLADVKEVPVIVRDFSDQQSMEISLIENIQREDLNPIEEAQAYQRLLEEFHLKQEEVAQRVSRSRTAVTNSLRLLKLCDEVQQMVADGLLTGGHARCLIPVEDAGLQKRLADQIVEQNLSVRETEQLVKALREKNGQTGKKKSGSDDKMDAIYADLAGQMRQILGTKVSIRRKNENVGKIEIDYYSPDELDRILQLIRSIDNA
ncbi:MAG: ParB/RepB/Spo0J family partition protein [Lachnospiraceae bacterium]|nr:ParB/RepB/Spo0J family partition protein [Clostridiales bacterium]MCC8141323.1 ParB/RepB/Spo0J family partition protein [Lachnospiraceae bacterium]